MVFGLFEGKLEIFPAKKSYSPGEALRGKVRLTMDKPQKARELRLEFYGELRQFRGRTTTTVQIHSQRIRLDGKKTYSGVGEYEFEFRIPKNAMPPKPEGRMEKAIDFLKAKPRYYLNADLDMEMKFDIISCVQVDVRRP